MPRAPRQERKAKVGALGTPALLVVLLYWLACPPPLSSHEGAYAAARGDTHVGGSHGGGAGWTL